MRNLGIALIAAAALCLAAPAFADPSDGGCTGNPHNCGSGDDGDDGGDGGDGGTNGTGGGVFTNTIDIANTNTNTNTTSSTADAFSGVDFSGAGFGAAEQATTIDVSDRSVTRIEAADIPVASAAPVFASACSAGVSGQSMGFGGSLATTNPMCDMALAAEMARAVGNDELAYELTIEAATFARARTNIVRRFGQWIPFVGSLW
jgi:hypothetical protein